MSACHACGRDLAAAEERRVPGWVAAAAQWALALAHGGLLVKSELSEVYCARCRARIVPAVLAVVAFTAAVAAAGIWLFFRGL